ncbi:MAG: hypothetical protein AB7P76_06645 [Candidatus Melainabacteria bacterium]
MTIQPRPIDLSGFPPGLAKKDSIPGQGNPFRILRERLEAEAQAQAEAEAQAAAAAQAQAQAQAQAEAEAAQLAMFVGFTSQMLGMLQAFLNPAPAATEPAAEEIPTEAPPVEVTGTEGIAEGEATVATPEEAAAADTPPTEATEEVPAAATAVRMKAPSLEDLATAAALAAEQ